MVVVIIASVDQHIWQVDQAKHSKDEYHRFDYVEVRDKSETQEVDWVFEAVQEGFNV